ncbi:MAG: DUF4286 family protein [Dysgonamonadaceae bacterium]|jgi:hypothetical protein|nr:DUF4286 family protein [Dysgonamonadaceae bacterium]
MIIYNITFHIEEQIVNEYLNFLKKEYIPAATKSRALEHPRLCKILAQTNDACLSYSLQFQVENADVLDNWHQHTGNELQAEIIQRFADKVLGFTTLLEVLPLEA